jgi:uncharacterized protein (TIGR02001 family)
MKMNKLALAVGALVISGSAAAEFSANIGATSNYVWRGVSQTDDAAAVSGGLDYAHESGFYAGTWASNVDFDDDTTAEVDAYGGFANELAGGLGYDVGVIYYWYPGAKDDLDFTEIYLSLSYGPVSGGVAYTVDKEDSDADDNDLYYHLGASFDVAETWSVGGTVGYYDFDSGGDYTHGQIDITKSAGSLGDFTLTVSNVLDQSDVDVDGDALVFVSWAKTFD